MDETDTRSHIDAHADAVVRGDMDAIISDFSESLRPQVPQLAQLLPQPTTSADVQSVEIGEDESVSTIRYSGEDAAVTIRARWQDEAAGPSSRMPSQLAHGYPRLRHLALSGRPRSFRQRSVGRLVSSG
jgi:hypothetical protein